ncbi:MAG: hypothetical protein AB1497_01245 [Bacillota bacterium]
MAVIEFRDKGEDLLVDTGDDTEYVEIPMLFHWLGFDEQRRRAQYLQEVASESSPHERKGK